MDAIDEPEEDPRLLSVAVVRSANSVGDLVELADLATELGIAPDAE